jgi:transcription antitermination factor NusG
MPGRGMYLLNASVKKIRSIMVYLKERGLGFEETKSNEYLVVSANPKEILPAFLVAGVKIMDMPMKDAVKMYKNYGGITEVLRRKKPAPEKGQAVRIIGGEHKDLHMSGKVVSVGQKSCAVEVIAWGNLIKVHVGFDDLVPIQSEEF